MKSLLDRKVEGRAIGDKEKGITFTVSFGLQGRGTWWWRERERHYVHCRGHHAECGLIGLFEMKYFVSKVLNYLSNSLCYFWIYLETSRLFNVTWILFLPTKKNIKNIFFVLHTANTLTYFERFLYKKQIFEVLKMYFTWIS